MIRKYFAISCLTWLTMACQEPEVVSPSGSLPEQVQSGRASSLRYLQHLLKEDPGNEDGQSTSIDHVVNELGNFLMNTLEQQSCWEEPACYQRWYERQLANTCAFTSLAQQKDLIRLQWDYEAGDCGNTGEPAEGIFTLTVYQLPSQVHLVLRYAGIQWNGPELNATHSWVWDIEHGGNLRLHCERFITGELE